MVMRELRLIPNSANFCYHIFCWWKSGGRGGGTFTAKPNMHGGEGSANSGNISLKFEVNSTLIFPVKYPLNALEES